MKEQYLTKEGMNELEAKLHEMKTVRRREIAEAIHTAKEQGDLSENAEYVSAKEEQRRIEEEIAELELTLKHAKLIEKPNSGVASVGSTVTVRCNGDTKTYMIVGSNEADPMEGKISNESPIGRSLLGKKKGDIASIPAPNGSKDCQIVKVA